MDILKARRRERRLSQRGLAAKARVSFRTVQLLESGKHDWRLSTLEKISQALGLPKHAVAGAVEDRLRRETDSVGDISERILQAGGDSWPIFLFNFVDEFRRRPHPELVASPPDPRIPERLRCLIASTVETLCEEAGLQPPDWCWQARPLADPWFVAGVENLKALALVHSPLHFRKRNLFVLDNFLSRS